MFKKTPKKPVLFQRTLTSLLLGLFTIATILYGGFALLSDTASAADTNSNLNFQARLQSEAGAVVPDGYYNIRFKLYSASSGGSPLWTETYDDSNGVTAGLDDRVQVINGYVSVNLGSQTAFPAINWDQNLYLTMDIGGTDQVTPDYDGEMDPRLKLTGVPYAFKAGQLAQHNGTTGYTSTLSIEQPTGGNQTFQVQDQGQAGTFNLLTENEANTNFIQNQDASPQTANFDITGTGTADSFIANGMVAYDFVLNNSNNANTVTLRSGNPSDDLIINLPDAIGASGQCLNVLSTFGINMELGYNNCLTTATGVQLQGSTPGTPQTGHINVTGTITGGAVQGSSITAGTNLYASNLDVTSAGALNVGTSTATSLNFGKTASNVTSTFYGLQVFKPTTGNDSTTSFQIQNAAGTALLLVDSTNSTIRIGGASNNVTFDSVGQYTLNGTGRRSHTIQLKAEYPYSVLDAGTGSNNSGSMTSGLDLTNRMNFYKWTTTSGTNQSYDVVIQVPIPENFSAWASSTPISISGYTSDTTNGTIKVEARDTGGTTETNCSFSAPTNVTPGSTSTWSSTNSSNCVIAGTYTAGGYMTLRVRMQSPASGDVRIGNITLSYLAKY